MADESIDILSAVCSDEEEEMMSIYELFSRVFDSVESCKERIEKIDRIHHTA